MKFDERDNFPAHNQGVPGSSPGGPTPLIMKHLLTIVKKSASLFICTQFAHSLIKITWI